MGGTLLQEFGHDAVILYFVHKVLRTKEVKDAFYIVSPAVGPKIDIYFWNPNKDEFTSGINDISNTIGGAYYIPEFQYRARFDSETMKKLDEETREKYTLRPWYRELSDLLNQDLKEFVKGTTKVVENEIVGDLPDIIGIDQDGNQTLFAEIKFEGFGEEAQKSVLKQFHYAYDKNLSFYLVLPKQRAYSRDLSASWIRKWMAKNVNNDEIKRLIVYQSDIKGELITPKGENVGFILVHNGGK